MHIISLLHKSQPFINTNFLIWMHLMVTDSYLQAQYKNLLIQAEMMELRTRVRLSSNYTFQSMSDCKMHILYCGKMHQKLGNYFIICVFSWEKCRRVIRTRSWSSWTQPRGSPWRRGWSLATGRSGSTRTHFTSPRNRWTGPGHSLKVQRSV